MGKINKRHHKSGASLRANLNTTAFHEAVGLSFLWVTYANIHSFMNLAGGRVEKMPLWRSVAVGSVFRAEPRRVFAGFGDPNRKAHLS